MFCIDVEPDSRVLDGRASPPFAGFGRLLELLGPVRQRLESASGTPARFTFFLRMDPQIEAVYGSADWVAQTFERPLHTLERLGDEMAVHAHGWRWIDGWTADHADDAWNVRCAEVGLSAYRSAFGRGCVAYRHGDRFMSDALCRYLGNAGIRADLTLEPGLPAVRGLDPGEASTGWLPDTTAVPQHAFHPSAHELLAIPLTSGLAVRAQEVEGRILAAGEYKTLVLWTHPTRFRRMLAGRLRRTDLSHLAFAIRSNVALLDDSWACMELNLNEVAAQLRGRHRWCTASEAAELIAAAPAVAEPPTVIVQDRDRAAIWVGGTSDPGFRAGAELDAAHALSEHATALVDRLRVLGLEPSETSIDRPSIEWIDDEQPLECPVCSWSGIAPRFAIVTAAWRVVRTTTGLLRCPACRSVVLDDWRDHHGYTELDGRRIDEHIEATAGIEAIFVTLSQVTPVRGLRLLDVGCGYGYAIDLSTFAWGWTGVGVDPGSLGARGHAELGLDIRSTEVSADLDGDGLFDVILASEVIEHVDSPSSFLVDLRRRLTDDGVLLLSTPDAAFVSDDQPDRDVVARLGLGDHRYLLNRTGFHDLLRNAGFGAIQIATDGATLRAAASPTPRGLDRCRAAQPPDFELLSRYCGSRFASATPDSALAVGMASRHVRYSLCAQDLTAAAAGLDDLRSALTARFGIDLDDPPATIRRAATEPLSVVVANAHFDAGMIELLLHDRPLVAAEHFAAAAAVSSSGLGGPDASPAWLELRSLGHAALSLARGGSPAAPRALARFHRATRVLAITSPELESLPGRIFTELVARGQYRAADEVRPYVTALIGGPDDASDPDVLRARLDALFSMAMLDLQTGQAEEAALGFARCADLAESAATEHGLSLAKEARNHEALALERLSPSLVGAPPGAR